MLFLVLAIIFVRCLEASFSCEEVTLRQMEAAVAGLKKYYARASNEKPIPADYVDYVDNLDLGEWAERLRGAVAELTTAGFDWEGTEATRVDKSSDSIATKATSKSTGSVQKDFGRLSSEKTVGFGRLSSDKIVPPHESKQQKPKTNAAHIAAEKEAAKRQRALEETPTSFDSKSNQENKGDNEESDDVENNEEIGEEDQSHEGSEDEREEDEEEEEEESFDERNDKIEDDKAEGKKGGGKVEVGAFVRAVEDEGMSEEAAIAKFLSGTHAR